jgi:hypothetical protein
MLVPVMVEPVVLKVDSLETFEPAILSGIVPAAIFRYIPSSDGANDGVGNSRGTIWLSLVNCCNAFALSSLRKSRERFAVHVDDGWDVVLV